MDFTAVLAGNPDRLALILAENDENITRGSLYAACIDFAVSLRGSGIRPGECVSIVDNNTVEFVIAFIGCILARAVAAPLNPTYKPDEFEFYLSDAKSKLLLVPSSGNANGAAAAGGLKVPVATMKYAQGRLCLNSASSAFKVAPGGAALVDAPKPSDVALFLHTSGTTSRPKGVPLTQANLMASLQNIRGTYDLAPGDRSLLVMPLFHVHGLMAGCLSPLFSGAAVILPAAGKFSAGTFWADAVKHKATFYTAVPTMHQILLQRAQQDYPAANPPPLRFIRSCSAALAPATLQALEQTFKVPVLEAYAMTEASHQMTSNPLPKRGPHKAGSVGKAHGGVSVAILHSSNKVQPSGTIGEVCIRGDNVTAGYLNNEAATQEAWAGGWFHTGDQGYLDADGYLFLTGRLKELINRGGEKISPIEIDGALLATSGVAEAVAFGAPDAKYGEKVCAAIVLKAGLPAPADRAEIVRTIAQDLKTRLAAFKVPDPSCIFLTDTLPKTATGKIQRRFMAGHFFPKQEEGKTAPRAKL